MKINIIKSMILVSTILILAVVYVFLSNPGSSPKVSDEMEEVYCFFEKDMPNDTLPRYECTYLKIIAYDINIDELFNDLSTPIDCVDDFMDLPRCPATEKYHFTKFPLTSFCDGCDVEGVICGAYHINYYNETEWKDVYELGMFTEPNISSKVELDEMIVGSGVENGR